MAREHGLRCTCVGTLLDGVCAREEGQGGTFDDCCLCEFYRRDVGPRCSWWTRLRRCCRAAASPGAHDRRSVKHMSMWREACLRESKSRRRCCGAVESCVCHAVRGVKEMSWVREPRVGESKSRNAPERASTGGRLRCLTWALSLPATMWHDRRPPRRWGPEVWRHNRPR